MSSAAQRRNLLFAFVVVLAVAVASEIGPGFSPDIHHRQLNWALAPEGNIKIVAKFVAFILFTGTCIAQAPQPKNGYVPDEKTAIKIVRAVLEPMIGQIGVKAQEPFRAELNNGVLEVFGRTNLPSSVKGGGGIDMRINKQTGEILGYYFMR